MRTTGLGRASVDVPSSSDPAMMKPSAKLSPDVLHTLFWCERVRRYEERLRQSSASRSILVMTLPTWITVASLGDHLRLLDLLRRIDLCGEAIMAVL
jgi:hypothetical protein